MTALLRRWSWVLWLTAVWVALWGDLTPGNLVGGAVVSTVLVRAFPSAGPGPVGVVRPLAALRFFAYFLYKLVEANFVVAWEVLTPSNESINEGIVAVPITGASDSVVTLLANAISLTPGTLTIEVRREPPTLYVHVLHLRTVEQTRRQVQELERLALAAFGTEASIEHARRWRRRTEQAARRTR
jgi:multicomponent Na+:H+ antiporter subunit E